jgi:hypothetical protein
MAEHNANRRTACSGPCVRTPSDYAGCFLWRHVPKCLAVMSRSTKQRLQQCNAAIWRTQPYAYQPSICMHCYWGYWSWHPPCIDQHRLAHGSSRTASCLVLSDFFEHYPATTDEWPIRPKQHSPLNNAICTTHRPDTDSGWRGAVHFNHPYADKASKRTSVEWWGSSS